MAGEHMIGAEDDDVQFMRTEDHLCLSCVPVSGVKRMALSGEVFGNRMCYLEDISNEVCCPDLASCIFVLEQAVSVRALQEMVNTTSTEQSSANQGGQTTFRTLLYGHAVLLRHYHSQMYLSCLSTSTSNDKLAFDVGLKEDAQGESCWWTIHPASKQRSEGEKVRFNDDVILVSVFSERYLHAYMSTSERGRVNASFRQQVWSLVPISSGVARVKNPGFVLGGDVIRLMHGNMDHCITTPPPDSQVIDDSGSLFIKSGAACYQARSLWRIECFKIKWYSGFVGWSSLVRLRHVTSGLYLAVIGDESGPKVTCISKKNASAIAVTFEMKMSKEKQGEDAPEQDNLGVPTVKYGDTIVFIRHVDSDLWISYETLELTIKGIGKVEEKRIIPAVEGHMDDCFRLVRAQEQEQKTALVIRICNAILGRFNRTDPMSIDAEAVNHLLSKSDVVQALLQDLIGFFSQPSLTIDHEERQLRLKALRNRQDLFQEEGMIRILIAAINFFSERRDKALLLEGVEEKIEDITNKLYVVLAALIKGNRTNCSNFAQSARLNWLVNRLQSQQASSGVLEVLHSVLVDSPEVLNMITESHILAIIGLLDRNGRDPKVLDVLCSLCVNNGVAVRANQNLICENLLQRRDLLLQTALVDHVSCMRPNILVGVEDGESMYKKWYFEVVIDHIEQVTHATPHIRIGWSTTHFQPSPGHGDGFASNGIGDNTYSYGFDGENVWFAGRAYPVANRITIPTDNMQHVGFKKNDVIGCLLDLNIPEMWFSLNGLPVKGLLREFNLTGMFYPAISISSRVSCRFILGGEHGRFMHRPPEGAAPLYEAMLIKQKVAIEPCFSFGNIERNRLDGPTQFMHRIAFTPQPVKTSHLVLPTHLENVRDRLAENIHELWSMNKIAAGWRFSEYRDDSQKVHPCLTTFDNLPITEKQYHTTTAMENLKSLLALGYHIGVEIKTDDRRLKYVKLPNTYVQANGYKPQPLDLSSIVLSSKMEELIETLAENTHNVWAAGRIKDGFTYGVSDNPRQKRSPHLIPYSIVDESIKKINRDTASETVKTLLAYGYTIDTPTGDVEDLNRRNKEATNATSGERISNYRTYRAEQTFAVTRGKWYYEVELLTAGRMIIGWGHASKLDASYPLGTDSYGYGFDGLNARRCHHNMFDGFGKQWAKNDVVGCMIDLHDKTVSFSLNGELMLDNLGNETAFDGLEIEELGFVPALTSFSGQKARLNFGQDVNSLKYFTSCGLQEGYEPFCVNMSRSLTFWYSNFIPRFETVKPSSTSFELTRVGASRDNPPLIKLQSRLFGTLDKVEFEFLRLSLPLCCHDQFTDRQLTLDRRQIALHEYIESQEEKRTFAFPPSSLSGIRTKSLAPGTSDTIDSHLSSQADGNPNFLSPDSITNKPTRNPTNLLVKFRDQTGSKKSPSPSPPSTPLLNGLSQTHLANGTSSAESTERLNKSNMKQSSNKVSNFFQRFSKEPQDVQGKTSKRTVKLSGTSTTSTGTNSQIQPQSVLKIPTINTIQPGGQASKRPSNNAAGNARRSFLEPDGDINDQQGNDFDHDDIRAINEHVHEYYYAIRILPGQNPRSVFIGWVTSRFKPILQKENLQDDALTPAKKLAKLIRRCTITQTGEDGSILESVIRQDAYMFCASDLLENMPDKEAVSRRVVNGLLIGCLCDISTGQLTFYVNGKESAQKLAVEPSTKLYPAVFVEPTVKEVLQFELGRIKNCLPLTAALFPSLNREERFLPQLPSRLNVQSLVHCHWSRVPNANLRCQQLKLSDLRGWSVFVEDAVQMQAVYIPEDDRCTDILGLVEDEDNLNFCSNTLTLYNAICAQGNNRVSHEICKFVDEKQLMYCVKNPYLCGPIRTGIHNLLIALHFEPHVKARSLSSNEYIIPLSSSLRKNLLLRSQNGVSKTTYIPAIGQFLSVRPKLIKEEDFKIERERKLLVPPPFNVACLKEYIMSSLSDAIEKTSGHLRDPVGGTYANWLVPLLQLVDALLVMGSLETADIQQLLYLIDPAAFGYGADIHIDEGLLQMKLDEPVKLQLCYVLQHLCNYQLQYRIEGTIAFSEDFVGRLQSDQKRRYNVLKESSLPPALMAKKTREFRCPPKDQMQALMDFKEESTDSIGHEDMQEEIKEMLKNFHSNLLILQEVVEPSDEIYKVLNSAKTNELDRNEQISLFSRLLEIVIRHALKNKKDEKLPNNFDRQLMLKPGKTLCEVIKTTVMKWGRTTHINDPNLIREMFKLLYNQYDGIGEVSRCLERTYIINEKSVPDITTLLRKLSVVRALLTVQMDSEEEGIMISCLNEIMDNRVFYQHPDLMRSLCVHETVMAIMVNRLNKSKQEQTSMSSMNDMDVLVQTNEGGENQENHPPKEDKVELVTTCCKFLSYFCRTSRHNQRAMFEHLSYLLENSSMLLSRPSLRGSAPLDVASASVMDNNELALALRESHLEKIASYLSRCGTTRNEELFLQGYHDIGWDPVDGERFLDFLKFCVWVNGDTVEENADLVVRLLIRRPDCLGPALRGEGGGLLKAIREGIAQSLYIARRQNADDPVIQAAYQEIIDDESMHNLNEEYDRLQVRLPYEDDEEYIDLGAAELSFYAILVELLGRCAPSEETIKMGKPNAMRAKSILKSLVSMHDLEGVLGLKFLLPNENSMPPGLQPAHKMSIILFLERVYGIPDQETFFRLIEDAFLPDIRAATILDMASIAESDMALALNRYLCTSVIPIMTTHAHFFDDCDHRSSLLESTLHTVYRLSKCRSLTKNQLDTICDFLLAFANQLKPSMMTPLLRKLVHDIPALTDQTIVPLRMLTQWYERCSRYYSTAATEEEKRLTMMLFQKIFDSLASRAYDPELFGKALPCLTAIGSALSPDYSYSINQQDNLDHEREKVEMSRIYEPNPADTLNVVLSPEFEEFVKAYAESVHDQWSYAKIEQGWGYGEQINDKYRQHPNLKPYKLLDRKDTAKLEDPIREALKSIDKLHFRLEKTDTGITRIATKPLQRKKQKDKTGPDYTPKAMDFTSVTMNREMQELSEALAQNAHEVWAKQMKNRLAAIGGGLHSRLVPYDLLTDKEKQKDLKFYQDLVKYLNTFGYRVVKKTREEEAAAALGGTALGALIATTSPLTTTNASQVNEKRFAYTLLEKLLEYVERASSTMQNYKESSKFSLHESYRLSTKDVKFFGKVVLPLVEKYFQAHRDYFITPSSLKTGTGYATVKEKEMSCSLFCKLAFLLRQKFSAFGNEVNISVRCLKVLVRAIDVSSVMKNSQEMVRASVLPLFNNIAEDLNQTVQNLEQKRFSHIKGTLQRGTTSLSYIHMVLLPVLSSMLDHLGKNNYGVDVFENEIQLAGYKILNALWVIGTQGTRYVDREWIIDELNRHRPLVGDCLSSFASCFPVAFFEPEMNSNNKNASNVSQLSPEANDVMTNVARTIPHLTKVITEIEEHSEAKVKYEDAPYVIEVILPCVCSYLQYWWSVGPSKTKQSAEPKTTNVTADHMNSVLGSVLKLINNNIDATEAPWMKRIAVYTQAIILSSSGGLLEPYFLPVSQRLKAKCEDLYNQEQSLKHATRLESSEREDLESNLMKNYEILVRDLYAFGPLLIKYVDIHRSSWLKNGDLYADQLFNNMAEVFSTWCKSKYFKREELNFVTQHEIDNTSMLMPSGTQPTNTAASDPGSMKATNDAPNSGSLGGKQKRKKRRLDKEKFTSLSVACIKRLLPVGMNTFGGREQELVQLAKHKMIEMKIAHDEKIENPTEEQLTLELTGDQEENVEEFLRDIFFAQEQGEIVNKNNWQSALYRKIGSKSHQTGIVQSQEISIKNMLKMAKALFGLNLVDHPPTHRRGIWRKLVSSQRKKAIMACFRMAPLHSVPRHRAMNMFLRAYREIWLEAEEDTRARLVEQLCEEFQETNDQETTTIKEETETDTEVLTLTATVKPDPLRQLLQCLNRAATTAQVFSITEDVVYLSYSTIMSKSCVIEEDDDDGGAEEVKSFQEQEMEKQKLLYEQNRLANRGAAETVLLYISASKGENNEMLQRTLQLGISLLHGGNREVQKRMLDYLKETKDVGCFTSLATLMANCSVLDLDTFERCIKAEVLGVGADGMAGEKNLHDADFTISLFRFCQLLCEGHNLEFQNYLRLQAGNNTNVNIIICTVDYLLSLQESLMDFYWHYSGKETVDAHGKENFVRAINVAKQVFNTLTEYIQGPCPQNQLALANSRLWDAIAGFLYIFAHMQRKLSQDPMQIELLRELMKLQKDMIIMLLSMLEGNVLNGPIGKQMVDTLIESQSNVELLLQFFDIFLKMKGLTTSEAFQEFDTNKDGFISPKEFRRAMEAQKMYTGQDIDYILMCVDTNQDGKIDFMEFTERFHNPAKDIGFNMAVLLTNLSEHMPHDIRLQRLMDKAKSFLSYFQDYLGRIEIKGGAGYIERVYFEITESNIEQWIKPHIKESKKAFLHLVVNETDDKEKLEQFINFCEDTIFEMQHAVALSGEEDDQLAKTAAFSTDEPGAIHPTKSEPIKLAFSYAWAGIKGLFHLLRPSTIRSGYQQFRQMTLKDFIKGLFSLLIACIRLLFVIIIYAFRTLTYCIWNLMVGDEQQDGKADRVALPPPTKRRDHHLPSINMTQVGFGSNEESSPVNAFGVGLSGDPPPKHKMSITDDQINTLNFDSVQTFDSDQKPLFVNSMDSSVTTTAHISPSTQHTQHPHSITASVPHQPQLTTTVHLSPNMIEKSKQALEINVQAEYQQKPQTINLNGAIVEDDDFIPPEPPARTDYGKKALALVARNYHQLKFMALCLAFIINFLMLFYKALPLASSDPIPDDAVESVDDDENEVITMDPKNYYMVYLLQISAFLHSTVAFLMMISYYKLKVPLVIFKHEKEIARKLEFEGAWLIDQPGENNSWIISYLSREWHKLVISSKSFPDSYWDKFVKKKVRNKYSDQFDYDELSRFLGMEKSDTPGKFEIVKPVETGLWGKIKSVDMRYQVWKWGVIFTDNAFLYVFFYFIFSVIGNFSFFVFAIHLLDVAISVKALSTILKSITHNGRQLVLTIMLMAVVVYLYTVIAFNFFRKFYTKEEDEEKEENCKDMFTCFKFHLYSGIRAGGGIGDELESPNGDPMELYRIVFDITFFFFIIVILLAIIQGLIIDAFGDLREQLDSVKETLESKCFICGIGQDYFDKEPHGFETHTTAEHNFANYMFFLTHLLNKPDTEHTGQESYVWEMYQSRKWDFFPVGDCFRRQYEPGGGGATSTES